MAPILLLKPVFQGMPGEMGKPVNIPKEMEEEKKRKFKINQEIWKLKKNNT